MGNCDVQFYDNDAVFHGITRRLCKTDIAT